MNIYVGCFDKKIKVSLPDVNEVDLCFWIKRFCPNSQIISKCANFDFEIECLEDSNYEYKEYNNKIILSGVWENYGSFLAKFITQVFQKLLISQDIFFIPAACVSKYGECILIIGDFGQGKTSTALEMSENYNFDIISDNYVAIKNNVIIGSTGYVSLREENDKTKNMSTSVVEVNNRLFFEKKNNDCLNIPVKFIIVPFINSSDNNFHDIVKEESVWYLYQKFSRLINGETVLFNGNLPSPSFNSKDVSLKLLNNVNKLLLNCDVKYASSSLERISKKTNDYFGGIYE